MKTLTKTLAAVFCAALLIPLVPHSAEAAKKRAKKGATAVCAPKPADKTLSSFPSGDAWTSPRAYKFPFLGYTPRGKNTVIWKKITGSRERRTHYPAPNLPSCRVGLLGTEDRTSRKAGRFFETPKSVGGARNYTLTDTWGRTVAQIEWKDASPIKRLPNRWGWYVNGTWAGHDATRAWEVQGNACSLAAVTIPTLVNGQVVNEYRWVRDMSRTMVAFNPALGSPGGKTRPGKTSHLRVRAFIDRSVLPGWANLVSNRHDFGCGASALPPRTPTSMVSIPTFKSGYGAHRQSLVGQYFGEGASPVELLPGETKAHNNMPLSTYAPKYNFGGATYAMNNTTGVSGGGMVRGIFRSYVDNFTMVDEMAYCDPNYTLRNMLLKRNGKRVSKWSYFELAHFSRENKPTVRWVFGRIGPEPSTLSPEGQAALGNPASLGLFAWIPIGCDR